MNMAEDTGQRESRHTTRYLSLCVMIGILFVPASTNTVVSEKLIWWDARASCQTEHNGDLHVPGPMHLPPELPPNTWYWIGALKTSEWKWTDNSSPFRHIGYLEHSRVNKGTTPFNLPGNSVAQCYSYCYHHSYFGLSKTSCYCLGDHQLSPSTTGKGSTCPGNLAETCGNTNELSVYKTDIDFSIQDNKQCVFGSWQNNTSKMELLFLSTDCRTEFPAVCLDISSGKARGRGCSDGLCVSRKKYQWLDARNNCNLVNGTDVNKLKLLTDWKTNYPRFWIGLNRTSTKKWIDERITTINQLETSTSRLSSKGRITKINQLETSTYRLSSNATIRSEPEEETGGLPNGADVKTDYGVFIGTAVGIILLAGFLTTIVVILKREQKMCFQKQQIPAVRFQPGTENLTDDSGTRDINLVPSNISVGQGTASQVNKTKRKTSNVGAVCKESVNNYSEVGFDEENTYDRAGQFRNVGVEEVENVYSHLKADEENAYDIAGREPDNDRWDSTYSHVDASKVNKTKRKTSKAGAVCTESVNNYSEVGLDEEGACNRAGQLRNVGAEEVENVYSHLKADEENAYDIADRKPDNDRWDSTYSHVDASKVNKTKRKTSKVRAVCKESVNNYSEVGLDEEDAYDRAGQLRNVGAEEVENVYSHLKADEENTYDIAGRKPDNDRWDSTYSHVDARRVDEGKR